MLIILGRSWKHHWRDSLWIYSKFGLRQTTLAAGQAAAQSTAGSGTGQGRCPGGWPGHIAHSNNCCVNVVVQVLKHCPALQKWLRSVALPAEYEVNLYFVVCLFACASDRACLCCEVVHCKQIC